MNIPLPTPEAPNLQVLISIPLPAEIADRLPDPLDGVRPHITAAASEITEDQARHILYAFTSGEFTFPAIQVELGGVGDFRTDDPPFPVVFLEITSGTDLLQALAALLDEAFGLGRRFPYHPHVTLAYRREDDELDRIAAAHHGFTASCTVTTVTIQFGLGTDTTPRVVTWDPGQTFTFAIATSQEGHPE